MSYSRGLDADYEISQKNIFANTVLGYGTITNYYSIARNAFFFIAIVLLTLVLISISTKTVPILQTSLAVGACAVIAGLCHLKFKPTLARTVALRRQELNSRFDGMSDTERASMLHIGTMRDIHDRVGAGPTKQMDKRLGLYGKSDPQTGKMIGLYGQFDHIVGNVYGEF